MNNSFTNAVTACFVKNFNVVKQNSRQLTFTTTIMATTLLSACQLAEKPIDTTEITQQHSYSEYYLWLKSLTSKQVLTEEKKQKSLMTKLSQDEGTPALSKLILIYSLPNTSLHQPYKAKRLLNEYLLLGNKQNNDNLAFFMLLRDQLNTQLKLLQKQEDYKKDFNKQNNEHHAQIDQLQQQLDQVNQQLILLKRIDQNINGRG